jgi:virulence factor
MTNPKPIHVGVVGCGWIMRSIYIPTLLSLTDRVRVAAVCDLNEEAAHACGVPFHAAVFTDIRAMLQETKLDAVMVLTSEKVNAIMARLILKANLPVFLEKPPAISSEELEDLIATEALGKSFAYTAFNRRHTPLFAGLDFDGKLVRISGALKRLKRPVATFPHTSIHLIDSAQYLARSPLENWKVTFEKKAENSAWTIDGHLKNGAAIRLEFVPDGAEFAEYLSFETERGTWELQFPNTVATVPEGELILNRKDGSPSTTTHGQKSLPSIEAMGFRLCLGDFIDEVENPKASSAHRLVNCRATIRVIEEMEASAKAS